MLFLSISFILDDAQYTSKPLSVVVIMLVPNILSKKPNRKELAWGGVIGGGLATEPPGLIAEFIVPKLWLGNAGLDAPASSGRNLVRYCGVS